MGAAQKTSPSAETEILALLESAGEGTLSVDEVIEWARGHPDSALHTELWIEDDAFAATYGRRARVRDLIRRCRVRICNPGRDEVYNVRAAASLPRDRKNGDGYRLMTSVLSDDDLSAELLTTAKAEATSWWRRFRHLSECRPVADVIYDTFHPDEPTK